MSWSGIFLVGIIVLAIVIKSLQNHLKNKKSKTKRRIFGTKDLVVVILNVGFISGGFITLLIGLGYNNLMFGPEITMAQPIINIFAGILFVWFGIKFLFWEKLD